VLEEPGRFDIYFDKFLRLRIHHSYCFNPEAGFFKSMLSGTSARVQAVESMLVFLNFFLNINSKRLI
jgi:hypothetical protein